MRAILIVGMLALSASTASAQVYHQGYFRQNGTYVQPHYQSAPDSTPLNNYSTQGNVNPYTGQQGTVNPYAPKPLYPAPAPLYSPYGTP